MDKFSNATTWVNMFSQTLNGGHIVSPREKDVFEMEDFQISIDPRVPFMTFEARKYDINYFKAEMIWKLSANKYNDSIIDRAKLWKEVQNPNGTFNSNYGQYWFGEQMGFFGVITELMRDPDSRRAVIPMLSKDHLTPETTDTVCTECIGFRIRNYQLNMSVHMRSSDQILGLGTDIPTFSFLYRLVYAVLKDSFKDLQIGRITITAMSSHIYCKHADMVMKIIEQGVKSFDPIEMPWAKSSSEALFIVAGRGDRLDLGGELGRWLGDTE